MNVDKIKSEKLAEIGMMLRNKRIEMQISISDLAVELNLNYKYIDLIEKGQIGINDDIFYVGYITSIGKFLNLDVQDLLCYFDSFFKLDYNKNITDNTGNVYNNIYSYVKNTKKNELMLKKYKIQIFLLLVVSLLCFAIYYFVFL